MGIKAAIHRFVLWAPVALASGYIGVFVAASTAAAFNLRVRGFVDNQVTMLYSMKDAAYLWYWLIGACAIWLGAYFFSKVDATPHPKHRLYLNADREEGGDCHLVEYIAAWSPCYYFWMPFSDYWNWSRSFDRDVHRKVLVGWNLCNPGPGDVFHVRITWKIKQFSPRDAILKSGLFSGAIDDLTKERVALCREGVGAFQIDLSTEQSISIPLIKADTTAHIELPKPLNNCLAVAALVAAKEVASEPTSEIHGTKDAMAQIMRDTRVMPDIEIRIDCETELGKKVKSNFIVKGIISGRVGLHRPVKDKENHYEQEPHGISAWIRLLEAEPF